MLSGRWVFSSSRRATTYAIAVPAAVETASRAFFSLFYPDDCRVCRRPLTEISRVPVCRACLGQPEPLVAEHFCVACRTPFRNAFPLDAEGRCALCRGGLRGFDAAYCFGAYEGTLRELIHLYKYGRIKPLARALGGLLATALPLDERFDAVVPVPLHWRRQWQRGFNQSELLARLVARRCGIPVRNALRRVQATRVQAGLSNSARRDNVASAFRVRGSERLDGLRLLLVDDVLTTGSTATACARTLKRAGARRVAVLTIARVDRRFEAGAPVVAAKPTVRGVFAHDQ
jgi:ComF family protein